MVEPQRKPHDKAGLSRDQESALVALEQVMSEMKAHGDGFSQWRLLQIERAIAALDRGDCAAVFAAIERARLPAERITGRERAKASHLERRLEADQLLAAIEARRHR